jgi:arylsulfatase
MPVRAASRAKSPGWFRFRCWAAAGVLASAALTCAPGVAAAQDVLPRPEQGFQGYQGRTRAESSPPAYPEEVRPPAGAPNVLLIMTDDAGFAASSTFGGPVPTPTFDALAAQGLKYTGFNTAAICSPTRAALLTGRNQHRVGMATVPEAASGYDGYDSVIPRGAGTVAQVLKAAGYNTAMFGKWHLTPTWEQSAAGPFDRWPTHMGFEYFYGFLGGEVNQFAPKLVEGETPIQPALGKPGYHLDHDLADHAVSYIYRHQAVAPDKPFFIYYAPGTSHSPHDSPPEWMARFKGRFDRGWDVERDAIFRREKQLGVVPPDARLTPRPARVAAWDSLTADQKALAARQMEAYAGALSYADDQIGRVIAALKATGQFDNTLVIYIQGDNGASAIGGLYGSLNDEALYNLAPPPPLADDLKRIDDIGGPKAQSEYPLGWGHALDTPFQYYKAVASHFGGTRNGMVIEWPGHTGAPGIRTQFHYVTDIYPTILEAAGVAAPTWLYGVQQLPLDGISMLYTLKDPKAPTRRTTQYFMAAQNAAIYHQGWIAATTPMAVGMVASQNADDLETRRWELYNVDEDFSEAVDLASKEPARLRRLQDLFWVEAARNSVLPIDRFNPPELAAHNGVRRHFTFFPGVTDVPEGSAPAMDSRSFRISAFVDLKAPGEGVLATQGGRFMGFGFYMQGGKLDYTYNYFNMKRTTVVSDSVVPPGRHKLTVDFRYDGGGKGKGGDVALLVDDRPVGRGRLQATRTGYFQSYNETFDVGEDTGTAVVDAYQPPFRFTGVLEKLTVDLE